MAKTRQQKQAQAMRGRPKKAADVVTDKYEEEDTKHPRALTFSTYEKNMIYKLANNSEYFNGVKAARSSDTYKKTLAKMFAELRPYIDPSRTVTQLGTHLRDKPSKLVNHCFLMRVEYFLAFGVPLPMKLRFDTASCRMINFEEVVVPHCMRQPEAIPEKIRDQQIVPDCDEQAAERQMCIMYMKRNAYSPEVRRTVIDPMLSGYLTEETMKRLDRLQDTHEKKMTNKLPCVSDRRNAFMKYCQRMQDQNKDVRMLLCKNYEMELPPKFVDVTLDPLEEIQHEQGDSDEEQETFTVRGQTVDMNVLSQLTKMGFVKQTEFNQITGKKRAAVTSKDIEPVYKRARDEYDDNSGTDSLYKVSSKSQHSLSTGPSFQMAKIQSAVTVGPSAFYDEYDVPNMTDEEDHHEGKEEQQKITQHLQPKNTDSACSCQGLLIEKLVNAQELNGQRLYILNETVQRFSEEMSGGIFKMIESWEQNSKDITSALSSGLDKIWAAIIPLGASAREVVERQGGEITKFLDDRSSLVIQELGAMSSNIETRLESIVQALRTPTENVCEDEPAEERVEATAN